MSPADASAATVRRLLAEIRLDHASLDRRAEEAVRYQAARTDEEQAAAASALALDRSYAALEAILERAAEVLEGGRPQGPDWHQRLLAGAALDIERVRPPILSEQVLSAANDLRGFRHFLHHAYGADLNAGRVRVLTASWAAARPALDADLDRFETFLRALADELERQGAR